MRILHTIIFNKKNPADFSAGAFADRMGLSYFPFWLGVIYLSGQQIIFIGRPFTRPEKP